MPDWGLWVGLAWTLFVVLGSYAAGYSAGFREGSRSVHRDQARKWGLWFRHWKG